MKDLEREKMNSLVISIVTWNSAKTITECIKSVLAQSVSDFQLFIVDNNSLDNTVEILESFNDSRIKLFKMNENFGFCGGHNYVISNSESDYVLLVNPDILLSPDYLEKVIATIKSSGNSVGTVCGLLLQNDPSSPGVVIDSAGLEITNSRIMKMRHHGERRNTVTLKQTEVFGADGALPLYNRVMIRDVSIDGKFFDEMFFAHKEDWDVSWRSHLYGWKTIFNPDCVAVHPRYFKPGNIKVRSKIKSEIKVHSVKNQLILLLKNESLLSFITNCIFIIPRQVLILLYIMLFERTSLEAYRFVIKNLPLIIKNRKIIQKKRVL
ncbi:MAG: glycosyltransferase family 2 protein [Cyclobacteriaceae bacterium]|nr:glycosyltransferase family 2 protein [Cyclobacteriaceae bacterium]